jgi:hypothetical protein
MSALTLPIVGILFIPFFMGPMALCMSGAAVLLIWTTIEVVRRQAWRHRDNSVSVGAHTGKRNNTYAGYYRKQTAFTGEVAEKLSNVPYATVLEVGCFVLSTLSLMTTLEVAFVTPGTVNHFVQSNVYCLLKHATLDAQRVESLCRQRLDVRDTFSQ